MAEQHPDQVPKVRYGGAGPNEEPRWWKSATPARDMVSVAKRLDDEQRWRRRANTVFGRLYTGRKLRNIYDVRSMPVGPGEDPFGLGSRLGLNVVEAVIDTIVAKIAKNRPRSFLLTEGGTWSLERQAKQLMKYLDGVRMSEGVYKTGRMAFRDALVYGTGWVKVSPDYEEKKCCIEKPMVDSMLCNEAEAASGKPRTLYQKHLLHRDVLWEQYATREGAKASVKKAIDEAVGWDPAKEQADPHSPMVWTYEGWSIRGKHVTALDYTAEGADGELYCEDWAKNYHTFVRISWREDTAGGLWGIGVAEDLIGIQTEINNLLLRMSETHRLMAVARVFAAAGTKLAKNQLTNEVGTIVDVEGPVTIHQGVALPDAVYKHLWDLFSKAFEIMGVSMLDAAGTKPTGVNAAIALQEIRDVGTERFNDRGQDYEQLYVDTDRLVIRTSKEMYSKGTDIRVKAPGTKFISIVNWSKVDIDEDYIDLKVWPTNILPASPAGRLQRITELYQAGLIPDRETALSLLDAPDLESALSLQLSAIDDIKRILELITEEGEYEPPEPFINLDLGARMAQSTFLKSRQLKGFPEARLDMLVRFADACLDLLTETGPQAQTTVQPGAAPPDAVAVGQVVPPGLPAAAPPPLMQPAMQ